jgi:hypothetical protein
MPNSACIGQPTFSFGLLKPIETACLNVVLRRVADSFAARASLQASLSLQQRRRLQPSVRDLAAHERASFALMCHLKIRGRRECRALDAPAASHAKIKSIRA